MSTTEQDSFIFSPPGTRKSHPSRFDNRLRPKSLLPIALILTIHSLQSISTTMAFSLGSRSTLSRIITNAPRHCRKNGLFSSLTSDSDMRSGSSSSSSSSPIRIESGEPNILRPLIVCGPSGVGKGTIIEKYMKEHQGSQNFSFTVSHTTRKPRPGEVHGIHYHFLSSTTTMKEAISNGEFLEHAEVHGNMYGTSLESLRYVQDVKDKLPLLDIDVQGVKSVKETVSAQEERLSSVGGVSDSSASTPRLTELLRPRYIFIAPPSMDVLKERLRSRGTESEESLERRTRNAVAEMEYGMMEGNFDEVVVNDDLEKACLDFCAAIERVYQ